MEFIYTLKPATYYKQQSNSNKYFIARFKTRKTSHKNVQYGTNANLQYLQAQNDLLRDIMTLPDSMALSIYKLTLPLAKQQKYEFRVALFLL